MCAGKKLPPGTRKHRVPDPANMWLTSFTPDVLAYGDRIAGINGMVWTTTLHSKYDGRWAVTQIYRARYHISPGAFDNINTLNTQAVDSSEYYDGTHLYSAASPATHPVQFDDYPELSCPGEAAEISVASAEDYVRFKPGRADGDGNIYVTLGIVNWNAHGEYSRVTGWGANRTPPATAPRDSTDFPWWVEVVLPNQ
jgi:hypothetical protein